MGWSYVSPHEDSDGSGQDTPLCFLSMHLVFTYFILHIKSQAAPPPRFPYSNKRLEWEVNSWIWGNNSHMGLQIIDVFWLSVCDCNCKSMSVLADICCGGIFTWRFSDAFLMSSSRSPHPPLISGDKVESKQTHLCGMMFSQINSLNEIISIYSSTFNCMFLFMLSLKPQKQLNSAFYSKHPQE